MKNTTDAQVQTQEEEDMVKILASWASPELDADTPSDLSILLESKGTTDVTLEEHPSLFFYKTYSNCRQLFVFSSHQFYNTNNAQLCDANQCKEWKDNLEM